MSMQRFYLDVVVGGRRGPLAALLRAGLRVLSWGYRPLIGLRNLAYDRGWRQVTRLEKPVVSVGNLTTGGTGKTPWVMEVVRRLEVAGHDPVVLSRGYHGGETADEPAMLEAALGEGRVFVDADRVEAGRRALSQRASADRVVLDDGFQHRRLGRDLDLVLIDATRPFGGGAILPRGLMREPKTALGRADMIILTRVNRVDPAAVEAITRRIKEVA
ncbi:MAG: tetraacyldisaccharide 4'-kinase, partial [Phycisphaeraceae bacterium]|nr:tetraacyldisaccharide 4'-kinase [Phycisphaeraceae bacterium]